jgi:pimeloyl-ACP methyl ester carboxylesterase
MSLVARFLITAGLFLRLSPSVVAREAPSSVVLLVHGIAWNLHVEDATWGRALMDRQGPTRWTGMIGHLESRGLPYGGTIRAQGADVRLPQRLDAHGVRGDPRRAKLFVLKFSPSANVDGLALKALELAEAIEELRRFTGARQVRIVAHSAGGLVARAYLQNALPGVRYRGDVDRLITISTPHLGSALARHFGDYLGTRATSVKPDAPLIKNLNEKFDLPPDTLFASIVVRGLGADVCGRGKELDHLVDHQFLAALPLEYRTGGDEVVHVRSQNLRLAACAARYEQQTGRPIQYVLVRVPDPSPDSWWPKQSRVHSAAPAHSSIQRIVGGLLSDRVLLWRESTPENLARWRERQARLHAKGIVESQSLAVHPMSHARELCIDEFRRLARDGQREQYAFAGKAWSENSLIPLRKRWTRVRGTIDLSFDPFGRVLAAQATVDGRENL